jgi:guanylate kinase
MKRRGLLIILSSPSGAGKSTLARRLMDWDDTLSFSVSATTRAPRPGEVDGQHYHFLDEAAFKALVAEGAMLEHAHVFGNFYGSPMAPVKEAIEAGATCCSTSTGRARSRSRPARCATMSCRSSSCRPSIPELRRRLESRGQDAAEVIAKRMQKSWDEISHWDGYDYVLVNDDLDQTFERLKMIVTAERLRQPQQPGLADHVRRLHGEFDEGKVE